MHGGNDTRLGHLAHGFSRFMVLPRLHAAERNLGPLSWHSAAGLAERSAPRTVSATDMIGPREFGDRSDAGLLHAIREALVVPRRKQALRELLHSKVSGVVSVFLPACQPATLGQRPAVFFSRLSVASNPAGILQGSNIQSARGYNCESAARFHGCQKNRSKGRKKAVNSGPAAWTRGVVMPGSLPKLGGYCTYGSCKVGCAVVLVVGSSLRLSFRRV